ncbi:hypothetical protein EVAR_71107_1 [Eumeta japonica]|uniref:Uncharacterized protein n=1 Tax=Eumeta variegata TaxID=151549 RepID=A0A4C1SBE2_EUMVA|nr:hypothetical protein EVAR_71107_1 [Eumeta japonica]
MLNDFTVQRTKFCRCEVNHESVATPKIGMRWRRRKGWRALHLRIASFANPPFGASHNRRDATRRQSRIEVLRVFMLFRAGIVRVDCEELLSAAVNPACSG